MVVENVNSISLIDMIYWLKLLKKFWVKVMVVSVVEWISDLLFILRFFLIGFLLIILSVLVNKFLLFIVYFMFFVIDLVLSSVKLLFIVVLLIMVIELV